MSVLSRCLALLALFAVAGCGGGMQAGVGSGGSGAPLSVGLGTVTGFGSIIANGEHYDETGARFFIDQRPDHGTPATVAAIRLGMRVELQHRNLAVASATTGAELIGPVSSVSASGFVALGQTVLVNSDPARPTVFDGFDGLGDLAGGAVVEVHGERADTGDILATRVELKPSGLSVTRVAGAASNVTGRNFYIGNLAVDGTAAVFVPAGATVANGERVTVWTDAPYAGGALAAKVVRVGELTIANSAAVALDGAVGKFQSASNFRVSGIPVDAGSAAFVGGSAADLAGGRAVRVRGSFGNGALRASSVEFLRAAQTQLTGPVNDFVDATAAFHVRNALVRVTPQTTYAGGSAANLGSGVVVRLTGDIVDGAVHAATVEFLRPTVGVQRVVFGAVSGPPGPVAGDGSFTLPLAGVPEAILVTTSTSFRNGVIGDLSPGRQLKVLGTLQGAQFLASEIQFMDNPANPPTFEIEGIATDVQAHSATVNGQSLQLTASTLYTLNGAAADSATLLVKGARVDAMASRVAGVLTAQAVDVRSDEAGASSVRGLVTGRVPPDGTLFLVGAQRVSVAGSPRLVPASRSLADIVDGTDLEVDGALADGVLNATRVRFK
jgi:hypothetical protein